MKGCYAGGINIQAELLWLELLTAATPVVLNHPNDRCDLTLVYPSPVRPQWCLAEGQRTDVPACPSDLNHNTEDQKYKASTHFCILNLIYVKCPH